MSTHLDLNGHKFIGQKHYFQGCLAVSPDETNDKFYFGCSKDPYVVLPFGAIVTGITFFYYQLIVVGTVFIKHIRALDKFNMEGEIKILLTFTDQ